jgi:hypothetical protein
MSTPNRFLADGSNPTGLLLTQKFDEVVQKTWQMATPLMDNPGLIANTKDIANGETFRYMMESIDVPTDAVYHAPGAVIRGRQVEYVTGTIGLDPIMTDAREIDFRDARIADFDFQSGIAQSLVNTIKMNYERKFNILNLRAARATAQVSKNGRVIHNGGVIQTIVGANWEAGLPDNSTGADAFEAACHQLCETLDTRFVPRAGRVMRIAPRVERILRHKPSLWIQDYKAPNNLNSKSLMLIAGFNVVTDPNLDYLSTNIVDPDGLSKYSVNCTVATTTGRPAALVTCGVMEGKAPVGIVRAQGIRGFYTKDEFTNRHFFKADMLMGADIMHPYTAAAIEVRTA